MSFKFDFFPDKEDDEKPKHSEDTSDNVPSPEIKQVFVEDWYIKISKELSADQFTFLPYCPFFKTHATAEDSAASPSAEGVVKKHSEIDEDELGLVRYLIENDECGGAESDKSDLIPNVYEGGHKIWECSLDLCEYLSEKEICFEDLNVLELGCGCGVPGIFAYVGGAASVHFQDYNKDVLEKSTIPNLVINLPDGTGVTDVNQKCQFWFGDWRMFSQQTLKNKYSYDIILTSETIYSVDNYGKLHECLESVLDKNGTIYLSAKSYYFGVGGGTQQFIEFVEEKNVFSIEIVKTIDAYRFETDGLLRLWGIRTFQGHIWYRLRRRQYCEFIRFDQRNLENDVQDEMTFVNVEERVMKSPYSYTPYSYSGIWSQNK